MSLCNRTTLYPTRFLSSTSSPFLSTKLISSPLKYSHKLTSTKQYNNKYNPSKSLALYSPPTTTTSLCVNTHLCVPRARRYATAQRAVVDLECIPVAPTQAPDIETNGLRNTLVLHGLFGSGNNWRGMSKKLSDSTQSNVYLMDLRNHGSSPHTEEMTYELMADDVKAFIDTRQLHDVSIVGHSMGGKVAMVLALKYPELVQKLLIVDISPYSLANSQKTFNSYSTAMVGLNFNKIKSRKAADEALQHAVPDFGVRGFLLTNLIGSGVDLKWKCNLNVLHNKMGNIMDWPHINKTYKGPTLFIGGTNSNYISEKNLPEINHLFPSSKVIHIEGAGHWVHAEKPQEFLSAATEFLNKE